MAIAGTVYGLGEKLTARSTPAVTRWNRLEGRPRSHDFGRALKAEVRDALWMLTKQWQLGEFRGDDAGSPNGPGLRGIRARDGVRDELLTEEDR